MPAAVAAAVGQVTTVLVVAGALALLAVHSALALYPLLSLFVRQCV